MHHLLATVAVPYKLRRPGGAAACSATHRLAHGMFASAPGFWDMILCQPCMKAWCAKVTPLALYSRQHAGAEGSGYFLSMRCSVAQAQRPVLAALKTSQPQLRSAEAASHVLNHALLDGAGAAPSADGFEEFSVAGWEPPTPSFTIHTRLPLASTFPRATSSVLTLLASLSEPPASPAASISDLNTQTSRDMLGAAETSALLCRQATLRRQISHHVHRRAITGCPEARTLKSSHMGCLSSSTGTASRHTKSQPCSTCSIRRCGAHHHQRRHCPWCHGLGRPLAGPVHARCDWSAVAGPRHRPLPLHP